MPDSGTRSAGSRLEGKVAVVTGAGATGSGDFVGIGQAISILFARQGAKVLLVDRDEPFARFTINRPDKGNMLTLDGMVELAEAMERMESAKR